MSTELEQTLNDLILARERINANLSHELYRTERLSEATRQLQALNDRAQDTVVSALQKIGVWPPPINQQAPFNGPRVLRQAPPTQAELAAADMFRQIGKVA